MPTQMKKFIFDEYSDKHTLSIYLQKAEEGFWLSEKYFIDKYFIPKGKVLDLGCGTGRTTIPLKKASYNVIGVDLVPQMISIAKEVAHKNDLDIRYEIGDATDLNFEDNYFDNVLFSNNGWAQITTSTERLAAFKEISRVLKKGGIFIFTAHRRSFSKRRNFWIKKGFRFYVLKKLGYKIEEESFGDIVFTRKVSDDGEEYELTQFTHHSSANEVKRQLKESGLNLVETNTGPEFPEDKIKLGQKMFYVCQKYA